MDPRLLDHYERELQHLREMAGEFAAEFPKIAGRLGLDAFECADPYVERLLEGFAFLAGRVQLELDAQFPRFTSHLLQMVYPHYLAPIPSMAVVRLQPDLDEAGLGEGFVVPRGTDLRSRISKGNQTRCVYRTAHDVTLWPIELLEADYLNCQYSPVDIPDIPNVRAVLHFRLRSTAGLDFHELPLETLPVFLRADTALAMRLYEHMLSRTVAVVVRPPGSSGASGEILPPATIRQTGFDENQSLFPYGLQSFHGYRLLHEYFAFPERFMFVEFSELAGPISRCTGPELEILVLLDRVDPRMENVIKRTDFDLFCTPAINLFPRRADRIHLTDSRAEFHVVPDRTRPMDFEVYDVTEVVGFGTSVESQQEFRPFYAISDTPGTAAGAYYTLRRTPRLLSARQKPPRAEARSSYIGTEVFVSLVDSHAAPYDDELRQLGLDTLCTNRDLPLHMPVGAGETDFTLEISAPVNAIVCVAGPTKPRPSLAYKEGEAAWRIVNHLSLNYLTLADTDARQGAAALRELLRLYANDRDAAIAKQIEGVVSIRSVPQTRRLPTPGPIVFGRALEITVTMDESAFEGTGIFLLGSVLDHFFAKYVTINSMTETVIRSTDRGEVKRWPVRTGKRHAL